MARWAAVDAGGTVVAVAAAEADLATPTGGTVVNAGHPVGVGFTRAGGVFSPRPAVTPRSHQGVLDDLPRLIHRAWRLMDSIVFEATSKSALRKGQAHLIRTVNALLIDANREDGTRRGILMGELRHDWGVWVLDANPQAWSTSLSVNAYYRTATNGGPVSVTGMVVTPQTYTSHTQFIKAYRGGGVGGRLRD